MNIRMVALHEIKPYENNVKQHPVRQLEAIMHSIQQFGFRQPIVIDRDNTIVAGHARYEAATTIGMQEVPCEIADNLTEQQINAYRILDNEIAKQGYTDESLLKIEMEKLPEFDFTPFNLELPDFNITNDGLCDEDEVPEPASEAITKRGEVWILGNHRLMCGDSTLITDVDKLMNGEKANLMLTDPPYGVNLDQSWRDDALPIEKQLGKGNRNKVSNDDRADWKESYTLFPGNIAYVWHASKFTDVIKHNLEDCDFDVRQMIIWNKSIMVMGRSAYHWKHEPCWYAVRKGCDANWKGDRKQTTVWDAVSPNNIFAGSKEERTDHPTQKPVLLFTIPIINHTENGDVIYDPFGGSGTTLIACEKTNRKCFMMEISEHYCDIIVKRWQKFTGHQAVIESTGMKFDEVANV